MRMKYANMMDGGRLSPETTVISTSRLEMNGHLM